LQAKDVIMHSIQAASPVCTDQTKASGSWTDSNAHYSSMGKASWNHSSQKRTLDLPEWSSDDMMRQLRGQMKVYI
jgi:hypothetical protein